jgi:hypothetical protein
MVSPSYKVTLLNFTMNYRLTFLKYVKSVLPEDGDGASHRTVVFKRVDAAVRPRRLYCMLQYTKVWVKTCNGKRTHRPELKIL